MKPAQFYVTVGLAALCLVLSLALIALGQSNQRLQRELQKQQEEINRGNVSQQVGTNIVRDMAGSAVKNEKMKEVLARHGISVTQNDPAAAPGPAASPSSTP